MPNARNCAVSVLSSVLLVFSLSAGAAEKRIKGEDLPPAVQRTFHAQEQGAIVKGFTMEIERGKRVYEAQMKVNGHSKDVEAAEDGTLNEIEEEVTFDSLPLTVQTSLHQRSDGGRITKVESLTKQGAIVAYEATTRNGRRRGEIQVGPTGEKLDHEE